MPTERRRLENQVDAGKSHEDSIRDNLNFIIDRQDEQTEVMKNQKAPEVKVENKIPLPEKLKVQIEGAEVITIKGPKGDKGDRGDRGPDGPQGREGSQGKSGKDGRDGKDGGQGPRGERGEKGDKGEPGKDGKEGRIDEEKIIKEVTLRIPIPHVPISPFAHTGGGAPRLTVRDQGAVKARDVGVLDFVGSGVTVSSQGNGVVVATISSSPVLSISFLIDGGGSAITTGVKGDLEIPFNCTINSLTMLADQSGSIVVDIWKDTYANYPPTVADTITASAKPTISTAIKSQDTTLTGWTTTITAGDSLRFNVDSATSITRVLLSLKVTKT